jgi:hypothetical protein
VVKASKGEFSSWIGYWRRLICLFGRGWKNFELILSFTVSAG